MLKKSLPVALLRVDKNLSHVTAPGSIKRACLNRVKYGQELHERMDMLYTWKLCHRGKQWQLPEWQLP